MKRIENKALEIHRNAIVIDGLNGSVMDQEYFKKMLEGGITATNHTIARMHNLSETIKEISNMYKLMEDSDKALLVNTAEDIRRAKREGKVGIILGFQNIAPLDGDLSFLLEGDLGLLKIYQKLGVRVIQLTFDYRNPAGDGCREKTDSGLSFFGEKLVKEMNKLGIVIDLAHVSKNTALEAIEVSKEPVIASHSNAYSLVPTHQNKDDEVIKAIAEKGGVIGATLFPRLLGKERATIEDFLDHIDYMVNLVGVDYVGIGSDFGEGWIENPALRKKLLEMDGKIYVFPKGIDSVVKFPNITAGLLSRGYSDDDVEKIIGGNFLRVFERVFR
ncbi:MAG: dipeptidase [Candidatus Bathyarchaeia archaeon]